MLYLEAEGLSKVYGDRVLFENLGVTVAKGEKIALVARNGTGKSTLLDLFAKREEPDTGWVHHPSDIQVSYLPQNPELDAEATVLQAVLQSDNPMARAVRAYEQALKRQSEDSSPESTQKLQEAMDAMEAEDAWDYESKVSETLSRLNILDHEQQIKELSGGQKKRVALAKVLIEDPDFMIMDEPTNHLDLDMVEWLEEVLTTRKMTLLLVTHDRYFLNNVTNQILELERGQLMKYKGNFEYYLTKKAELEAEREAQAEEAQKQYAKELQWVKSQPKARGTKAKSRVDRVDDLKEKASQKSSNEQVNVEMKTSRLGKKILNLENVSKQFDDKPILNDFSYEFQRGERIGIVGPNGSGKTTFLNILTGALKPDSGKIETGETIVFGYYKQEDVHIPGDKKVIEVIRDVAEVLELGDGRTLTAFQLLERFLFPKKMHYNYVYKLSGGEKRRLHLLTVIMKSPNFLILDEPTNDLDILTLGVLEDFLKTYPGCLITVTHDRYFLDKLVDHLFVFEGEGKVVDYNGTYSQYRQSKKEQLREAAKKPKAKPQNDKAPKQKQQQAKLSYKEKREMEQLEKDIEQLEEQKSELQKLLNAGEGTPEEFNEWARQLDELQKGISEKETRWMELAEVQQEAGNE